MAANVSNVGDGKLKAPPPGLDHDINEDGATAAANVVDRVSHCWWRRQAQGTRLKALKPLAGNVERQSRAPTIFAVNGI